MAKVIFSRAIDKKQYIIPFIEELSNQDRETAILIVLGLEDLEEAPDELYPLGEKGPYKVKRIRRNQEVEIELVKRLSEPRIYEMKVDRGRRYHRFIYFPYRYKGELSYIFVYGFTKIPGKPDRTNAYMTKAKQLYNYLKKNHREEEFFEE